MDMARPPATSTAPNALAAYMRAFRAWKSGRGEKPAGRAAFVAEFEAEAVGAELELRDLYRSIDRRDFGGESLECGWAELRDAILDLGGIRASAGVDHGWEIPAPIFRTGGVAVDLMVGLLADYHGISFGTDHELLAECWHRFTALKRHREAA
jgi:hypothetical protein